jgi:hypothetical protein
VRLIHTSPPREVSLQFPRAARVLLMEDSHQEDVVKRVTMLSFLLLLLGALLTAPVAAAPAKGRPAKQPARVRPGRGPA